MKDARVTFTLPRDAVPPLVRQDFSDFRALSLLLFLPLPIVDNSVAGETTITGTVDEVAWHPSERVAIKLVALVTTLEPVLRTVVDDEDADPVLRRAAAGALRIADCWRNGVLSKPPRG